MLTPRVQELVRQGQNRREQEAVVHSTAIATLDQELLLLWIIERDQEREQDRGGQR